MNPSVGIDLGTTNTVIAIQTDSTGPRTLDISQPVDERNSFQMRDHIKSAVYFESVDSATVGAFAARRLGAFRSVKSVMGTRWRMPHPFRDDFLMTPPYVSAHILRLGFDQLIKQFPDWDKTAIITVPASFNTDQRSDTLHAAKLAGFHGVHLLDEPTAAFYYFFEQNRESFSSTELRQVLVFDFGGGTLDVSIIRVRSKDQQMVVDAIGRSRYNNLGGDDIDTDLAAFLLGLWELEAGTTIEELAESDRRAIFQLFLQRASAYKEEAEFYLASGQSPNEFVLDEQLPGSSGKPIHLQKNLSRPQYEEITSRFFVNSGDLNVFRPIGQAFEIADAIVPGFSESDIDLVLYTGGASRMGAVKAAIETYFTPKPCFSISDEEACNTVALGAASCRYDERHSSGGVAMTYRLLESILTPAQGEGLYVSIVPLTAEPSGEFTHVNNLFRVPRATVNLRLPLFRGVGPMDHNLMPIQDLILPLPYVVQAGCVYELAYRVTENKTVQLRAHFKPEDGDEFVANGELQIEQDARELVTAPLPLATINGELK
jgi:molecular chaperone DnaK